MKFPIEMYRIREEDVKIKVPCERCSAKGIVNNKCNVCGGKGTHNKTIKVWKVMPRTETVEKIDRSSEDSYYKGIQMTYVGGLRYWTSYSEFFNEESKILHFNKNDAQKECDRRNANIADILKIHNENNKNNDEMIFVSGDRQNGVAMSNKGIHFFSNGNEMIFSGN